MSRKYAAVLLALVLTLQTAAGAAAGEVTEDIMQETEALAVLDASEYPAEEDVLPADESAEEVEIVTIEDDSEELLPEADEIIEADPAEEELLEIQGIPEEEESALELIEEDESTLVTASDDEEPTGDFYEQYGVYYYNVAPGASLTLEHPSGLPDGAYDLSWRKYVVDPHLDEDGDLMVEFFAFQDADSVKQYAALTLDNKDKAPHFYNLFKEIELRSLDSKQLYYSTDLYNILWGKLTKELKNKSRIYFSPCEGLYDIAIESLPVDSTHYISDLYDMYRLTSSRVILNKTSIPKSGNAVVFGGLNYTISSDEVLKQKRFSYLPGTKVEAEDVAEKLSQGNYKVSLITDNLGTESSFKSISGAELDLLHIATHGFYLNKDYQSTRQNKLEFLYVSNDSQSMEEEKAMSRSGLVFAGVNNFFNVGDSTKNANEDGFLTAVEISNLDFSRVKLVVLSACQTGLGDESGTEIYGLQRGFKLAGAKSIMMSLWKVDDYATQLLMESFYKSLMNEESPVLALKKAKMAVRKTYPSPRYWAPFIIVD